MTLWDVGLLDSLPAGGVATFAGRSVDGLVVTVKPPGREEYRLTVLSAPEFSSTLNFGYEQATVECELSDEERAWVRGGRLRVHGDTGIVWQGIVIRRPGRGEPLLASGWGWCTTLGRRAVVYCDTRTSAWMETGRQSRTSAWSLTSDFNRLYITTTTASADAVYDSGAGTAKWTTANYQGWVYDFGASANWARVTGTYEVNAWASYGQMDVYAGVHNPTASAADEPVTWGGSLDNVTGSAGTTQAMDASATSVRYLMFQFSPTGDAVPAANYGISVTNPKVYGASGVTSPTTHNVFEDILDHEVDTDYLPSGSAYRAWVGAEATVIEPLLFESSDAKSKLDTLTEHVANCWGFYMERVAGVGPACVPHWSPLSTTPDYIVRLDEAESFDMDEAGIDELYSAVRVRYRSESGTDLNKDMLDTDTSHPLVAAGITRYGDVSLDTSSSATASAVGLVFLAEKGRARGKGRVTTRRILDVNGAEVYAPDVRPGKMVRLYGLPDGQMDCIVLRATCKGDSVLTLELDSTSYRLDVMLARLAKRSG